MHTLNPRQLRALAIVAPGTLALNDGSTLSRLVFHVSDDDRHRTGVYRIDVDQDGNVTKHHEGHRSPTRLAYDDLIAAQVDVDMDPYLDAAIADAEQAAYFEAMSEV